MNVILTLYLDKSDQFHPDQHGFRPNRGTKTAWQQVLSETIHAPDIFEFDLKSFFDSVNLDAISAKLAQKGVPINIVKRLYYINTSWVNVKPPYKLNEFEQSMKKLFGEGKTLEDVVKSPRPMSYMYRIRGVPQGSPTSPALATLALEDSILNRPELKAVMYADDGLYYGAIDVPVITPNSGMVTSNIKFNLSKSGWVRKNGKWLKPLRFLGLEYNGKEGTLMARTKKGSNLLYDKKELIDEFNLRDGGTTWLGDEPTDLIGSKEVGIPKDGRTWESLLQSKLMGFIQSRLYSGSWDLEEFVQSFEYSFTRGSWSSKINTGKRIDVFNSTSYASQWLARKLSTLKQTKLL